MPFLRLDGSPLIYAGWTFAAFSAAFFLNSFIEWLLHKFVLHRLTILSYPYRKHAQGHHVIFDGDQNYHAHDDFMRSHITFTALDYILITLACLPFWGGFELLLNRPILPGCVLATLAGLQCFQSLHWRYHVPSDTWFQRTRFFRYLKNHHRLHHEDAHKNFNVFFFPIADIVLGTYLRR